jgi:transposase
MMSSSKGARLDVYQQSRRHPRKSLMGKEIRYTLEQWTMLCRNIPDRQIEIDNSLVENAIRPTAVGNKN